MDDVGPWRIQNSSAPRRQACTTCSSTTLSQTSSEKRAQYRTEHASSGWGARRANRHGSPSVPRCIIDIAEPRQREPSRTLRYRFLSIFEFPAFVSPSEMMSQGSGDTGVDVISNSSRNPSRVSAHPSLFLTNQENTQHCNLSIRVDVMHC